MSDRLARWSRPQPSAGAAPSRAPADAAAQARRRHARRLRLVLGLFLLGGLGLLAGLATGADGFAPLALLPGGGVDAGALWSSIVGPIRLPRTLGAALVGALLGYGGALAQGLFRNPLADPYLLGSAAGAGLGVVLVLALGTAGGVGLGLGLGRAGGPLLGGLAGFGLVAAAFAGALLGVGLTLLLASGAAQTLRLLLAGVVVGVLLGAASDLLTVVSPEALRGRQAFLLGSTSFIGWPAVGLLAAALPLLVAAAVRLARVLDALTLGEDTAASLGLALGRLRLRLVALLCAATALAVSQAGLVGFVGLVAPHLVRRHAPGPHRWSLLASTGMGAVLLLWADVLSRALVAPQELPVGVVTAVVGGLYLCALLRRGGVRA